jgi:hypothetical protein
MAAMERSAGRDLTVERIGRGPAGGEHYRVGECDVLQTDGRHLSISHPDRDPTWDEITAARYALLPRLRDCVLLLPPEDEYVNVHEHCFHVHLLRNLAPGGRFHNAQSW